MFIIFENRVSLDSLPAQPSYNSLAHDSDCANTNCILRPLLTPFLSMSYSLLSSALCLPSTTPWLSLSALSSSGTDFCLEIPGRSCGQCKQVLLYHVSGRTSLGSGQYGFRSSLQPIFFLSLSSVPSLRFIALEISQLDTNRKRSFLASGSRSSPSAQSVLDLPV